MSTILKALRRLERERSSQPERELRERVVTGGAEPDERSRWPAGRLRLAALAAGVVALLAGAWYLGRSNADVASQALARARPAASRRPAPMPPRALSWRPAAEHRGPEAPSPAVVPTRPEPEPASREPEPVAAPPEEPDFAVVERLEESAPTATKTAHAEVANAEPALAALPAKPVAPPPPAPTPEASAAETATAAPETWPAVAPLPEAKTQKILRMPIPEATLLRTTWHPDPERRFAELELDGGDEPIRLREGDALGPLIVVGIEPSGVVFRHEDVELRRGVGEAL